MNGIFVRTGMAVVVIGLAASVPALAQNAAPAPKESPTAAQPAPDTLPPVDVVQPKQKAAKKTPAKKTVAKKSAPKTPPSEPAPIAATEPVDAPPSDTAAPTRPGTGGIASGTVNMSPVSGSELPIEKVPAAVGRANASDIARTGEVPVQNLLQATVPSVVISDTQGNIFQTSVQYRGYEASPVNGIAQGLAVYQNGTRINESFGDTVNWDFLPTNAIDGITVLGANPLYGLNAIGGAIGINMRDGFNFHGVELDTRFGSYGRVQGSATAGLQSGNWAIFGAIEGVRDDGWRDFSESELKRLYADLGYRTGTSEFHMSFTGADNKVGVTAAAPVELLAIDRERTFTSPQETESEMQMVQLNGSVLAMPTLRLSANAYYRHFKQAHIDGNILDIQNCGPVAEDGITPLDPAAVCVQNEDPEAPGNVQPTVPLRDADGNVILRPNPGNTRFGVIDKTGQDADTFGGSIQATDRSNLFGFKNQFVVGASYDHGSVKYGTSSEFGVFRPKYFVQGDGTTLGGDDDFIPKNLETTNDYFGVFFLNTVDLTDRLSLSLGGRYNYARLEIDNNTEIEDGEEDKLSGTHKFTRFNPSVGLTYQIFNGLTAYGGYSEANRSPTTAELACADPEQPCLIESALVSDPPLEQVVSKTFELGLRGKVYSFGAANDVSWSLGGFFSRNDDDIILIAAEQTGRGFFDNVGQTERKGIEAAVQYRNSSLFTYASYAYTEAEFRENLVISAADNPVAQPCEVDDPPPPGFEIPNCVTVRPGDRLPGIPRHKFKAGFDYGVTSKWRFGADMIAVSNQIFVGDEGNDNTPLPGYAKVNLHTSYDLTDNIQIYGLIDNVFNTRYGLFGTYFNTDAGQYAAGADPALAGLQYDENNAKTILPAPPVTAYGGVKVRF